MVPVTPTTPVIVSTYQALYIYIVINFITEVGSLICPTYRPKNPRHKEVRSYIQSYRVRIFSRLFILLPIIFKVAGF